MKKKLSFKEIKNEINKLIQKTEKEIDLKFDKLQILDHLNKIPITEQIYYEHIHNLLKILKTYNRNLLK